jgi:hypothetical protein
MARVSALALALPVAGARVRIEAPDGAGTSVITRLRDGAAVGTVALEREGEGLFVRALCIDRAERSYGCGSEVGWLLVRGAAAAGFKSLRAWAAPDLGLSVYFWFRMGLRALPGPGPEGGIWMERRFVSPPA